jgi:hypothetical protein
MGTIVSRTVPIAAGQEATVSLFLFPDATDGPLEVSVEGTTAKETIDTGSSARYGGGWSGGSSKPDVLLSRSISLDFSKPPVTGIFIEPSTPPDPSAAPSPYSTPATPEPDFSFYHSELPANQWSPNWLGYSCFDAIVLTAKDVEQMPPEAQLALRRYLECGGTILVPGRKVPTVFSENAMKDGGGGYFVGRGRAVASGASDTNWNAAATKLRGLSLQSTRDNSNPRGMDHHHLLVAESHVPIRGMFTLVLLFAVAIGPANLWLLSRYKRRIWMWWNVPAISVLTCLAVFGYSVVSEGWSGHGKTASMTLLDQRTHRATTFGYASYYCPLTPASGPHFGADTDVTMTNDQDPYYGPGSYGRGRPEIDPRYVDFTSDQHLTGGWVRARVPAYFPFCKNEDRRERLNVSMKGDVPSVVNALGADIDRLYCADASGKIFVCRDIAAGAEKSLEASAEPPVTAFSPEEIAVLHDAFGPNHAGGLFALLDGYQSDVSPTRRLAPGSYIAYLKKSPFVEAKLEGVRSEDTLSIVYGICDGLHEETPAHDAASPTTKQHSETGEAKKNGR